MITPLLRIGVIGVGVMGADHVRRLTTTINGAAITAINDFDPDRAAALAEHIPGARVVAEPEDLIDAADVDAVLIASPGSVHEKQLLRCIEQNKPVLCEKPMTMDTDSAYRVVQAESETGKRLITVGFMRRFDPEFQAVKQLLDAGTLGAPLMAHSTVRVAEVPESFVSEMIVKDSIVHDIDVTRWLFDEDIATVTLHRPVQTSHRASPDLADPLFVVLQTVSGRLSTVSILVNARSGYQVRLETVGELGSVSVGHDTPILTHLSDGTWGGQITTDFRDRFGPAYDREVQDWVTAVRQHREPAGATAWDGYAATATSEAAYLALTQGGTQQVHVLGRP